ncbi:hypothetical protein [Solimicrobium silvestre]|uniref:Uncharacterized protein n=1 Tax=Solimicrobium silvestre TaxID=2099400 RepID=A0A2S9H1P8_9BURK|nr:hypothetical protein [Solimicrobium silvestre]PRC93915.1 hypothetical protein S2091_1524 [Solimicrobium silvestre]
MTTVNSALRPDLELISSSNRQVDAENQKDAWLRQLELSQMSLLQQLGQQNSGSSGNNNGSAVSKDSHDGQSESQPNSSFGGSSETTSATLLPVHPILNQHSTTTDEASHSPTQSNQTVKSNEVSHSSIQTTKPEQETIGQITQNQLDVSNQQGNLSAPIISEQLGSTLTQQISITTPTTVNNLAVIAMRVSNESTSMEKEEASESSEQQKTEPSETHDAASNNVWQKRLMHVAQEGKNVSVSIRDNTLDAHQSSQIVTRLAGDAAQSGLRLRNATVNGKTLLKLPRTTTALPNSPSNDVDITTHSFTSSLEIQE